MSRKERIVGEEAQLAKGWVRAYRWLILRRVSQLSVLGLFLLGPLAGVWIVEGNLASSMTLEVLPLTDPHILLQGWLAGMHPLPEALIGAGLVTGFYLLVGGRVYCAWVCPVNLVTDAAGWLRRRLGIKSASQISREARYWMLGLTLLLPLLTGSIVWELVNPVSLTFRGLVFGMGLGWLVVVGIFFFDLLVAKDGWCGRLCPVGAFYGLLGRRSVVRVVATKREACDDCMDCFNVCPEAQVIKPALKGAAKGIGPVILGSECSNCGRCIEVCARDVFRYGTRFAGDEQATRDNNSRDRRRA